MKIIRGVNVLSVLDIACLADHRLKGYVSRLRSARRDLSEVQYDYCCSPRGSYCNIIAGPFALSEQEIQEIRTLDFLIARCREEIQQRATRPLVDKRFKPGPKFRAKGQRRLSVSM